MLYIIAIVPWLLTVSALFFIIIRGNSYDYDYNYEDEDFDGEHITVRAAVYEDKAYWVYENVFYESDVMREPDFETARPIDTMKMNSKDLKKLFKILDDLEESEKE